MVMNELTYRPGTIAPVASLVAAGFLASACATEGAVNPGASAETMVLTESLRIGDEAAGDTVYFNYVWDMTVDSQGRILVADNSRPGFRVFTPGGALAHEIGSEGEGPGEFMETPLLYVSVQDSVYAFDLNSNRLTVYSPDSYELARLLTLGEDRSSGASPIDVLASLPNRLVVQFEHIVRRDLGDGHDFFTEIKILDLAGQIVRDSLVVIPSMQHTLVEDESFPRPIPFPRQFGRRSFVVLGSDDVIYAGWNENIRISGTSTDGAATGTFSIGRAPVFVTSTEKDARAANFPREWQEQIRQDIPKTKPAFNALVPDDEGQLWLKLSRPEDVALAEWLVVEAQTGSILAKASLPATAGILAVRQGKAYGVLDEDQNVLIVWDIDS